MITYDQIREVNEGMTGVDFKGKNYVMVNSRVTAFRKLFPEGFIMTDLISNDNGICLMQAKVGYYRENGEPVVLGTGLAYEKESASYINKTSYIENCETSAVGRALGFLALGADDSICSAEELANAITQQGNPAQARQPKPEPPKEPVKVTVTEQKTVPPVTQKKPDTGTPMGYLENEIGFLAKEREVSVLQMKTMIQVWRRNLVKAGIIPDIPFTRMSLDDVKQFIEAVRKNFPPEAA